MTAPKGLTWCTGCQRPMRPSSATAAEYPGSAAYGAHGFCARCDKRKKRGVPLDGPDLGHGALPTPPPWPGSWVADALCAETDPEAFFPGKGGTTQPAKSVCASCDVRLQCLQYALETRQDEGIWGGTSVLERRRMLKVRAA